MNELKRKDLIYPELSYKIVGCAFAVHNQLGPGFKESVYQKALSIAFRDAGLRFTEQLQYEIRFNGELLGKRYLDFCIEEKVVVEIKRNERYSKAHIDQVIEYLKVGQLRLALLINFGSEGIIFRRLINPRLL